MERNMARGARSGKPKAQGAFSRRGGLAVGAKSPIQLYAMTWCATRLPSRQRHGMRMRATHQS